MSKDRPTSLFSHAFTILVAHVRCFAYHVATLVLSLSIPTLMKATSRGYVACTVLVSQISSSFVIERAATNNEANVDQGSYFSNTQQYCHSEEL